MMEFNVSSIWRNVILLLDVFGSIYEVMQALQRNGYEVEDLPESASELMQAVIHDAQAQYASPELNSVFRVFT